MEKHRLLATVRSAFEERPRAFRYASMALSLARYVTRSPHESDFRLLGRLPTGMRLADIGANRGQSALDFAALCPASSVVSFEPNPAMARDLRLVKRVLRRRFDFHLCGLGEETSTLVLHVPMRGEREVSGEASFDRAELDGAASRIGGAFTVRERVVEVRRVDDYGLSPDVVKIDVQGFELPVIRGMRETLTRSRPMLLVEANPVSEGPIREHLARSGYVAYQGGRDGLVPPGGVRPLNWFYLPEGDDPRFRGLLATR